MFINKIKSEIKQYVSICSFHRDGICLSIANSATSIYAGFAIFSVLGFMAHELGTDISNVVSQGL